MSAAIDMATVWPALLAEGVAWRAGMLVIGGDKALRLAQEVEWEPGRPVGHLWWGWEIGADDHRPARSLQGDALPDLDDPATLGCLLAELRRVAGCDHLWMSYDSDEVGWFLCFDYAPDGAAWDVEVIAPTEGEALIRALCSVLGVTIED